MHIGCGERPVTIRKNFVWQPSLNVSSECASIQTKCSASDNGTYICSTRRSIVHSWIPFIVKYFCHSPPGMHYLRWMIGFIIDEKPQELRFSYLCYAIDRRLFIDPNNWCKFMQYEIFILKGLHLKHILVIGYQLKNVRSPKWNLPELHI